MGIKEQLRLTLKATTLAEARTRLATFDQYVARARMPEADRLKKTIDGRWPEIENFIATGACNAST